MNYYQARFYNTRSTYMIADEIAKSMLSFDPKAKKIEENIDKHKKEIDKLERRLCELRNNKAKELISLAERKKEEAKKIVELHDKVEREFEMRLRRASEAL